MIFHQIFRVLPLKIKGNEMKKSFKQFVCTLLIIVVTFSSCAKKNFEKKIELKPVPETVTSSVNEAKTLREYSEKLKAIDDEKILSQIKEKAEKEKYKYRILDFKIAYNKCVTKLHEVERKSVESTQDKEKLKKTGELKECMNELEAIWQYIIVNYKI